MNEFLFVVVPYLCLATFVVGHLWRYRYDKFGWTTRSSQLYESRLLRIGSPMFHFGIIGVFFGHVIGLGIQFGTSMLTFIDRNNQSLPIIAALMQFGISIPVQGLLHGLTFFSMAHIAARNAKIAAGVGTRK